MFTFPREQLFSSLTTPTLEGVYSLVPNQESIDGLVFSPSVSPGRKEGVSQDLGYSVEELLKIRCSLKLSSKLHRDAEIGWGPDGLLTLCSHSAEVGIMLAMSGASAGTVIAGFLYNSLDGRSEDLREMVSSVVNRKFGTSALDLIARNTTDREFSNDAELASLICARETARMAAGMPARSDTEELLRQFSLAGVDPILVCQYAIESRKCVDLQLTFKDLWSLGDLIDVRNALRFSSWIFKDQVRKWGPEESLPLSNHCAEVVLLAVAAGASRDVIVAAALHDAFEGYNPNLDVNEIRSLIQREFGERVVELIDGVTEPPKDPPESMKPISSTAYWHVRKNHVLENLKGGDKELSLLSCCTKISTIAAGNKTLWMDGAVSDWSKGSRNDNVTSLIDYSDCYEKVGIPKILREQLDLELSRFILLA